MINTIESFWDELRESKFFQILAILGIAVFGARLIIASDPNVLVFLLGPLAFFYFLVQNTRAIIVFFALVCYANYFIYVYRLPMFLTWYMELFAVAVLAASIGYLVLNREKAVRFAPYWRPFALILALHLVSFLSNKQSLYLLLMSSRQHYIFPAIFLGMVVLQPKKEFWEKLIKVMIFTMFFQIPVSIVQYFLFERADYMGGLFGKNSSGPISTLGIGFGFLGYYLYKYHEKKKLFLFFGLAMVIPLMLAESKFAMIFLPISYFYNIFIEKKRYLRKLLVLLGMVPFYLGVLLAFDLINAHNPSYYPYMKWTLEDPLYLIKSAARMPAGISAARFNEVQGVYLPSYDRLSSLSFALDYIKKNPVNFLFGFGPGEASQDLYSQGRLKYVGVFPTFLVNSVLEWGLLGSAAWLLLFALLFRVNLRCLRYIQENPSRSLWKAFLYFSNIQMFIFIFDLIYSRSFILDYQGLFFWVCNGLVVWYDQNLRGKESAQS